MIGLTSVLWLLGTALGTAQQGEKLAATAGKSVEQQARLYEDIEIMRRLLNRTLASATERAAHGSSTDHPFIVPAGKYLNEAWRHSPLRIHSSLALPQDAIGAEGIYLKGQGVVYSITLPVVHDWDVQPKAMSSAAPKPHSPWEQMRRELRGEKAAPEDKKHAPKAPSLSDAVLKLLAENGHHFRLLADQEQLTVAITFRGQAMCLSCHGSPFRAGTGTGSVDSLTGTTTTSGMTSETGSDLPNPFNPAIPVGESSTLGSLGGRLKGKWPSDLNPAANLNTSSQAISQSEVTSYLLLADLHVKQGRTQEAVEAYQKALQLNEEEFLRRVYMDLVGTPPSKERVRDFTADPDPQKWQKVLKLLLEQSERADKLQLDPRTVQTNLIGLELLTKLTQAYLTLGDEAKARQALNTLARYATETNNFTYGRRPSPTEQKVAGAKAVVPLPTKLIISAPKKLLDQVGIGKISFDEFKKAAVVEMLTFPAKEILPPLPRSASPRSSNKQ
ncbi:MAG: DUF1549 domain-containing protein [Gemmataceae bacterium]|nr:DUF1549 domain-containing protein [Gemmataceae bacterium]